MWTGVRGGVCDLCTCARGCRPRRVGVPVCVPSSLHHLLQLPSQAPIPTVLSKPTARQCPPPRCMRLAALSISVCLTKRKLSCLEGVTVPGPPQPLLTVLCYSHGAFLSRPFHYMLFPQEPQARGSERGPRRGSAPRTPPCRARVGVAVMASVDIL